MPTILRVPFHRGWRWVVDGFRLFRKNPIILIVLNMVLLLVALALCVIPIAGAYLLYLLTPMFHSGLMVACRDLEAGQDIEISHLFLGFRRSASQLITVGGVYLVGNVLVAGIAMTMGGEELREVMRAAAAGTPGEISPQAADKASLAVLVAGALYVPLIMTLWFAPALVILDEVPGWRALALSLRACLTNILPFLLYGLIMSALLLVAMMLFLIGLALWVPLAVVTTYVSFRDIFPAVSEAHRPLGDPPV
jgi:hypothetical protein